MIFIVQSVMLNSVVELEQQILMYEFVSQIKCFDFLNFY